MRLTDQQITNQKLHNIIESYHLDKGDWTRRDENHAMVRVIVWAIDTDDSEELTLEGGIDAHFDDQPELMSQLLAAIG
jgi:hypothetical protein